MLTLQVLNSKVMWLVERECLVAVKCNGAKNRRKTILPCVVFCRFISSFANYHARCGVVMQKDGAVAAKRRVHGATVGCTSRATRQSACKQKTADGTGCVMSILCPGDVRKKKRCERHERSRPSYTVQQKRLIEHVIASVRART